MPSFADEVADPGPDYQGPHPILGAIPSLPKGHHGNGNGDSATTSDGNLPRQHRAPIAKVATRQPIYHPPSLTSLSSQTSSIINEAAAREEADRSLNNGEDDPRYDLFSQVYEWLLREKSKGRSARLKGATGAESDGDDDGNGDGNFAPLGRTMSNSSDNTFALDKLEKILIRYAGSRYDSTPGSTCSSRRSIRRRTHTKGLRRGSASESDYQDIDTATPSVDVVLDNSKTLAYSGGGVDDDESETGASARRAKDREAWVVFKSEILRLAHTLQLKGWRKLPASLASEIGVVRLSGAMTNAIYMVTPPQNIPPPRAEDGSYTLVPRKPAPKLLLRIYGPQVDHLIDREKELQILRRLGRKNIGPKVLGTFNNGRFEEYFEARPLTQKELRDPLTMKQIAKRMRELHDGVDLLEEEREGGPVVFKNWDKWVDRCEQVTNWLDKELTSSHNESRAASEPWRRRGYVCGVPWPTFRQAVEDYRRWLVVSLGGMPEIKRQLVFSHNDTQYGNLLRMEPSQQSPLLLPENEHKQLVVIDFEYASANTPEFEFANHFTEWCYNYHDAETPWACNTSQYPTPAQQHQFITAYLTHRAGLGSRASPSITPLMRPLSLSLSTLAPLDLDAGPDVDLQSQSELERAQQEGLEAETQFLIKHTRLWRVFNSAQWAAWGIVQAKVAGMEEGIATSATKPNPQTSDPAVTTPADGGAEVAEVAEEADEFDYLAYAQDRAMFFWADLLSLGLIQKDKLPPQLIEQTGHRMIDY